MKRFLVILTITLAVLISVGGGGTYVALTLTAQPQFCASCHIMEPYYESWQSSSHKDVGCVDCHYEPGILETFEGKFKALSQLAKYVTATQGTKPWAEVSDYSCLRSGCHSERLLEGELSFGRIRFDHRHHLIGFKRGKKLRCTSCHSQIVQGEHLTVTKSTCVLCHFRESPGSKPINDCDTCHGPPKEEIQLGGFTFRHSEYLSRGVKCQDCHGDVTRGTGDVPRQRCGSCHNEQEHFDRYDDVEFVHRHHVADHSVKCLACHTEIEHSLPPRSDHFQGDCKTCHVGSHGAPSSVYRGIGGKDVPADPGIMFMARVTCTGCHRAPFPGAPVPMGGATFKADALACIDCHGTGYEGMADHWQAEVRATTKKVQARLEELAEMFEEEWEDGDLPEAKTRYDAAAHNLGLVLLDRSDGVHNLPYVRALLKQADADARAGITALDPEEEPRAIAVGPRVPSKEGCTQLCHVGVAERPALQVFDLPFKHAPHLFRAKLDCASCHEKEPHGTTVVEQANCVKCHHENEEPEQCGSCHTEVATLWKQEAEGAAMRDLDCLACHEEIADGHSWDAVKEACDGCHDDKEAGYIDAWRESATAPLREVELALANAPAAVAAEIRAELDKLRSAGPWHNVAHVRARAKALLARLK